MKHINYILIFLAALLIFASCSQSRQPEENYLVVLSMDGFRWDYTDRTETPNFDRIEKQGVRAEAIIPSFPSTTFANHYTMATGLYPDHHGILVNRFYAPDLDADFNKGDRSTVEDGKFYGGEPIWVTAETQGMKTATFFWVGSEADVKGVRPTYWKRYEHNFPYTQRIDTVIYWLELPKEQRPELVMWYFDQPDSHGHRYGPEGDSILMTVNYLDSLLGVFLDRMEALPHADKINFIVTSDHGMAQLSPDRKIVLDQYVDTSMIALIDGWNPTMNLKIKDGYLDEVYESLSEIDNLNVWKHGEVPERLHHGTNVRTHDLILVADGGWSIVWSWTKGYARGTHGYDPANPDMHAIFYAYGPDFKENHRHPAFQNIHLYPLMTEILGLEPAETDGSLDAVKDMLKK
jgi:predicted AlkP superfamily pyrophosphatase or phosphodiesterase